MRTLTRVLKLQLGILKDPAQLCEDEDGRLEDGLDEEVRFSVCLVDQTDSSFHVDQTESSFQVCMCDNGLALAVLEVEHSSILGRMSHVCYPRKESVT